MSSSPPTEAAAVAFVCACDEFMRTACKGLEEYKDTGYCVLHYPGKDKVSAFDEALKRKLDAQAFDFRGVWFPDKVNFSEVTFTTPADFGSATFNAEASFVFATFSAEAYFNFATFSAEAYADFSSATFSAGADFNFATFSAGAGFSS